MMGKYEVIKPNVVYKGKSCKIGDIIELSDENAEILKDRVCEPGKRADDEDPRSKAAKYRKEIEELEGKIKELEAITDPTGALKSVQARVVELEKQNKALHSENIKLKGA